jgi:WD40 repeat protein
MDLRDSVTPFNLPGHAKAICHIAFSSDGQTMLTAGDDQRIKFWRVESWRDAGELVFDEPVKSVGFMSKSDGDRSLVVGTSGNTGYQVSLLEIQPPAGWNWLD